MTATRLFAFCARSVALTGALVLLAAYAPANAQTIIRMTTTQGQPCVAVTDVDGLTLVPGSTDLQASGVTLTGAGCGGGSGASPPTSPNGLALAVIPATPTAGVAFSVSWQVSNASTCTGTVTGGTAANVAGWAQVDTPTSPRSVTISAAGTYALTLTCSNLGNPTNLVSPAVQVAVGDGSACSAPGLTRIAASDIFYGAYAAQVRTAVDVHEWSNIWGHYNGTDAVYPWPGISGSGPTLRQFQRTNFLAAHFRTGATTTAYGNFWYPLNLPGPSIDMKIGTTCGDFSPDAANPACLVTNVASADNSLVRWGSAGNRCQLLPNTDYYVNVKFTNPNSTVECAATTTTCPLSTISYFQP